MSPASLPPNQTRPADAPCRIAVIGAGSVVFTRHVLRDVLAVPELAYSHFALHDINPRNLEMAEQLAVKDIRGNGLPATLSCHEDRLEALRDADYVLNLTRIGGLEAFASDIEIPLKYGIDQCVGDTLCAGGIMYAQRNVPVILDFLRDIEAVARPGAYFFNYANPMAINCWAAMDYGPPGVTTLGFCHGIEHGWDQIAEALGGAWPATVDGVCAGINHQTWYLDIRHEGRRVQPEELLAAMERHPNFSQTEKVRIDVLRRLGCYSTESNGHLSEYLPWYRKRFASRPEEAKKWVDDSLWIHGETGGYLRVCTEGRNWFETDFPRWLEAEDPPIGLENRSNERASYVIEALETGRRARTYLNIRNNGCITNLPEDCVIEAPAYIESTGVHVPKVGDLPMQLLPTLAASVHVQRMAKEAAVHGDVTLLKQAMLHDPLVAAVCDPEQVWQMTDEMLVAQAEWLPQYAAEVPAAKRRLRSCTSTRVNGFRGALRKPIKDIGQLRSDNAELSWLAAGDAKNTLD